MLPFAPQRQIGEKRDWARFSRPMSVIAGEKFEESVFLFGLLPGWANLGFDCS